jgi:signal transduction histidine kinase
LWFRLPLSRISFRRQIILLGIMAVVLLFAVLFATVAALQYTRSTVLKEDQRRLSYATNTLSREYNARAEADRLKNKAPLLESADNRSSQEILATVSRSVLQNVDGVGGGFYAAQGDKLLGSYLPGSSQHSGEGADGISDEERPALLQVDRYTQSSERVLATSNGISLIDAEPLRDGSRFIGSAWTIMRLTSIPGANRFRTYLIAVALGVAALACVLLTLLVVRGLQDGVRKIEGGLKNLEESLDSQIPIEHDPNEIRQIAQAINRMGISLREKIESEKQIGDRLRHTERLAALGRLIAGVAHEVRNPLATIRLRVQMCQGSEDAEVRESCSIALQEIERLDGMVNRLLSFSRPVHLHAEPTDLNRLIEWRLGNFSELARQHDIRFVTRFGRNGRPVFVDQSRLAEVFDNVIQNAIDAMSARGGTLCVNVTREGSISDNGSEACVEFNDTGEGIPSGVVGRIFDPFFTTKSSGTGLGLSICHELIQAHGGEIQVSSAPGCGTTVRILLPVRDETATGALA